MKYIFIIFCLIFFLPQNISAHVLESQQSIGAILHLNPDDNPRANETQQIIFYFKDTKNKLNLYNCQCNISVIEDGKEIDKLKINPTSSLSSNNNYKFKNSGTYTISVFGKSKNNSFSDFDIDYAINVAPQGFHSSASINITLIASLLLLQTVILVRLYIRTDKPKT